MRSGVLLTPKYFDKVKQMATKAVRFSEQEDKAIKEFLAKNPFLDFSTLARMAILNFIENPNLNLKPAKLEKQKETRIQ